MTTTRFIVVWDQRDDPPASAADVLLWQSYGHADSSASVPRYLEAHAERIRSKFLAFVQDLGQSVIAGRRIVDHLDCGDGLSFWWMSKIAEKSPLKSPRIYDCLRFFALEEMLAERCASNLTLVSADKLLAQAMQAMCRNLQAGFSWERTAGPKRTWSLRRAHLALPHAVKGLLSLRHVIIRWPLRRLNGPQWFAGDSAIFMCSYFIHLDRNLCLQGQFHSRQWESLPKMLHESGRHTNWLQLFLLSAVVPDVETGLAWARRFNADARNQGRHAFLDTYVTPGVVFRALKCWLWLLTVRWQLLNVRSAFRPSRSVLWLWPLLRDDWLSSICGQTAMGNCLAVAQFDAALGDLPHQPIGLYLCENQAWEKALLWAWRKHRHGRIVGVQHATAPFWHLYYFDDARSLTSKNKCALPLPDRLATNGIASRQAFRDAQYPPERLIDVEALRYLDLRDFAASHNAVVRRRGMSTSAFSPHAVRVLVLGDLTPAYMDHLMRLVETARRVLPPRYEFTLKSHPGLTVDLLEYPGVYVSETREALHRILPTYDVAVAANCTSAAVDAFVAGLPVIVAVDGNALNLSPLRGEPGVHFVSNGAELAQALQTSDPGVVSTSSRARREFFFLDPDMPRWKRLLAIGERT